MKKYIDETEEEWISLTEYWHTQYIGELSLQEFLEMNDEEYTKFLHNERQ